MRDPMRLVSNETPASLVAKEPKAGFSNPSLLGSKKEPHSVLARSMTCQTLPGAEKAPSPVVQSNAFMRSSSSSNTLEVSLIANKQRVAAAAKTYGGTKDTPQHAQPTVFGNLINGGTNDMPQRAQPTVFGSKSIPNVTPPDSQGTSHLLNSNDHQQWEDRMIRTEPTTPGAQPQKKFQRFAPPATEYAGKGVSFHGTGDIENPRQQIQVHATSAAGAPIPGNIEATSVTTTDPFAKPNTGQISGTSFNTLPSTNTIDSQQTQFEAQHEESLLIQREFDDMMEMYKENSLKAQVQLCEVMSELLLLEANMYDKQKEMEELEAELDAVLGVSA